MAKRDLQKEKQLELAAIWGSEVQGDARFPKRKGASKKQVAAAGDDGAAAPDPEAPSDLESESGSALEYTEPGIKKEGRKDAKKKAGSTLYRLHCFVEPGTEINAVRTVFEAYEPKVAIRTAQKGNLLNKSQFAVLTFRNKAMALHAVQTLDGTNQRDLLGVKQLKLSLMLSRHQSKIARKKLNKQIHRSREQSRVDEERKDVEFIKSFLKEHTTGKK